MIRYLIIGLLALLSEAFLRSAFAADAWTPPFLILFMVWLGSRGAMYQAVLLAVILGLLADGFAGAPVGIYPLQSLFVVYASSFFTERIQLRGMLHSSLLGFLGGIAALLTLGMLGRGLLGEAQLGSRISDLLVPLTVMTATLAPPMFAVLDRWDGRGSRAVQRSKL